MATESSSHNVLMDQTESLRKMWQHEDNIANNRLTWFNTTQGLLFASLALVFQQSSRNLAPILIEVGIGACVLTSISLFLGVKAKRNLQAWWTEHKGVYTGPPVVGYYVEGLSVRLSLALKPAAAPLLRRLDCDRLHGVKGSLGPLVNRDILKLQGFDSDSDSDFDADEFNSNELKRYEFSL